MASLNKQGFHPEPLTLELHSNVSKLVAESRRKAFKQGGCPRKKKKKGKKRKKKELGILSSHNVPTNPILARLDQNDLGFTRRDKPIEAPLNAVIAHPRENHK